MPLLPFVIGVLFIASSLGCTLESAGSEGQSMERGIASVGTGAEPAAGPGGPTTPLEAPPPGSVSTTGGARMTDGMGSTDALPPSDAGMDATGLNAAPDATVPDASAPEAAADASRTGCVQEGRYAIRFDTSVLWEVQTLLGLSVIQAGEGALSMTLLVDLAGEEGALQGEIWPCDATQPEFQATEIVGAEKYLMYFDPSVWESDRLPRTPVRMEVGCDRPGCALKSGAFQVALGIVPPGDPMAPWPLDRNDLEYVDHDDDGLPGVTLSARGPDDDGGYAFPPVGVDDTARIESMQMGFRMTTQLRGGLDSCDGFSGTAPTYTMESHVTGCTLVDRQGGSCSRTQAGLIDRNLAVWMSREVTFVGEKVDDGATCADARAALPGPGRPNERSPEGP